MPDQSASEETGVAYANPAPVSALPVDPRPSGHRRRSLGRLGIYLTLTLGALVMIAPSLWQVLTSFKTNAESIAVPPAILPKSFGLSNYVEVFHLIPFLDMFGVSIVLAISTIFVHVLFGALAAYAFVFMEFRGRNFLFFVLLTSIMIPKQLLVVPQYEIINSLGLLNTVLGLVLPMLPSMFSVFLLRQFFLTLPKDIIEAARIDGANHFRTFWSIVLPLTKSGLIAAGVFTLVYSWNDLLWPLVVINDLDKMPLTLGLTNLQGEFTANDPLVMAAATMAIVPVLAVFFVIQRRFIAGIAMTGTKG